MACSFWYTLLVVVSGLVTVYRMNPQVGQSLCGLYFGLCSMGLGSPREDLEYGLEELKGFTAPWEEQ